MNNVIDEIGNDHVSTPNNADNNLALEKKETLEDSIQDGEYKQFLTFILNNELFGIDVDYVREVIEYNALTRIPRIPNYIRGVMNIRGDVVPVIDLRARFYNQSSNITKRTCIVVIEIEEVNGTSNIGVMIDAVNSVSTVLISDIEPAPDFGTKIKSEYINGICKENNRFILLLDILKILDIEDLAAFEGIMEF